MRAVVGMRLAVQLTEPWILREPQLVLRLDLHRRGCIRQHLVVKAAVARMLAGIDLAPAGAGEGGRRPLRPPSAGSGGTGKVPPGPSSHAPPGLRGGAAG